ncbi:MAG: LysR family transcriptional regulator [Solibacillus sp.]
MELRRIKYFIAIVEEGNISLAAKKLNMAQPPLSQQLKILEEELKTKLFDRNTRKLELTDEGKFFYKKSLEIMDVVERSTEELNEMIDGVSGDLNLGIILSLGADPLLQKIKDFHLKYPKVKFQVWEGDPNRIMELIEKRIIDLGIVRLPINHDLFDCIHLPDEPLIAVMSIESEINPGEPSINLLDLKDQPLMLLRRQRGTSSYAEMIYREDRFKSACDNLGFEPTIICESGNLMTLLTWANYDIGIAIIPKSAEKLLPNNRLVFKDIKNPQLMARPSALIWLKDRHLPIVAKRFKDYF